MTYFGAQPFWDHSVERRRVVESLLVTFHKAFAGEGMDGRQQNVPRETLAGFRATEAVFHVEQVIVSVFSTNVPRGTSDVETENRKLETKN
jgi:hypothetical protein